jgi:hypothetical protein
MSVDLHVSRDLLDNIGRGEFARYLRLFGATVVPTFRNDGENGGVSVSVIGLDYWDATGRRIDTEVPHA